MKKKISVIIAALLLAQNVSAAVVTRDSNGGILIEGSLGAEYKNTEVQIQILGPFDEKKKPEEAVFADASQTPVFMSATYANAVLTDGDGKYSFTYNVSEENKYYLAMINEPGKEEVQTVSIYAPSQEIEESFLAAVNSADSDEMLAILKSDEYKDILVGNRSDFELITDEDSLKRLADGLAEESEYSDFSEFENMLTTLCAVQLTNTLSDANEAKSLAEEKLDLSKSGLIDTYNSFSEEVKTDVFERMLNSGFGNFDEYLAGFEEGIFLEKVKAEQYASNMTQLINSNAVRFGFALDGYLKYSDKVNKELYGKDFAGMDSFKQALAVEISNAAKTNTSTGGGSSGGGSGSGGSSGGNIVMATGNQTKTEVPQNTGFFDDLGNTIWAEEAINSLAQMGVVSGKEERRFAPQDNIKREEFVRMVVKAFGLTDENAEIRFDDVQKDAWYYNDIAAAFASGIISGTDENNFGVGMLITRQDMSAILYRTAQRAEKAFGSDNEIFDDDNEIADYAKEAVYALKYEGVVSGVGENRFAPKKNATRAEAAMMIYTMMKIISE